MTAGDGGGSSGGIEVPTEARKKEAHSGIEVPMTAGDGVPKTVFVSRRKSLCIRT